jgi:hypothetical protein
MVVVVVQGGEGHPLHHRFDTIFLLLQLLFLFFFFFFCFAFFCFFFFHHFSCSSIVHLFPCSSIIPLFLFLCVLSDGFSGRPSRLVVVRRRCSFPAGVGLLGADLAVRRVCV